jgi:hypothetical protein
VVHIYPNIRRQIPEGSDLNIHCCENPACNMMLIKLALLTYLVSRELKIQIFSDVTLYHYVSGSFQIS